MPTILAKDCQIDLDLLRKQKEAFSEMNSEALQLAVGVLPTIRWDVEFLEKLKLQVGQYQMGYDYKQTLKDLESALA